MSNKMYVITIEGVDLDMVIDSCKSMVESCRVIEKYHRGEEVETSEGMDDVISSTSEDEAITITKACEALIASLESQIKKQDSLEALTTSGHLSNTGGG